MSTTPMLPITELIRIKLESDEILAVGLPETMSSSEMQNISSSLRKLFGKDARVMLYKGEWKFHAIKIEEAKAVQEANEFLNGLKGIE